MITIEMISAAIYTVIGLAALVVALTQLLKNWLNKGQKRWVSHLLSFVTSLVCCTVVMLIGAYSGIGIFAAFCMTCVSSWFMFVGTVLGCTGIANGLWTYDFVQKILEWIKLLPKKQG